LLSRDAESLLLRVSASPPWEVRLWAHGAAECGCAEEQPCPHAVAAWLFAQEDGSMGSLTLEHSLSVGRKMSEALSRLLPGSESVRLGVMLRLYPDSRLGLGLSVGQERMYAVRNIADFIACHRSGEPCSLSPRWTYHPAGMRFAREDERILSLLAYHMAATPDMEPDAEPAAALPRSAGRFTPLTGALLYSMLSLLESRSFLLADGDKKSTQSAIRAAELPLCFCCSLTRTTLSFTIRGAENLRLLTDDGRYGIYDGRVIQLRGAQARICALLPANGFQFAYPARDAETVLASLLPALSRAGAVLPSQELSERLMTADFRPRVYLDYVDGSVEARLEFHYGDMCVKPFHGETEEAREADGGVRDGRILLRDGRGESALLDFFADAGFVVSGRRMALRGSKDILAFCTQGVTELAKLCEIFVSPAFERIKPRRLSVRAAFRMRGGRLVFSLLENGGALPEVLSILQAVRDRQPYVRLRAGEFLDLRDLAGFAPMAQELLETAALDDPHADARARELAFAAYRGVYLVSMLEAAGIQTAADAEVKKAVRSLSESVNADASIPPPLLAKLSPYQLRGVNWLLSLHRSRLGGVLADEMGLGKTVQVIAAVSAAKQRYGAKNSLIVTPTSLIYHWLAECKRFDDALTVRLLDGGREERADEINEIISSGGVDIILTSYPLLRRDIGQLSEIPYRFVILDEAQNVKNAQSLAAVSAKGLDAETRLALTGTPMENHTGELWSVFDFALPGYLGGQAAFLRRYGDGERAEELRGRIRPFLMRRLKSDVLSGFPEKHEQRLYTAMVPEQEQVYAQLMATLRQHVDEALRQGSLPRARMQVLSVLLKLRQVCCHPILFLPDYEGKSGKLELLVQTVRGAIEGKRRMLIFSQFVGMLQIIRKRLAREGIKTQYLDGETPPETRQQLCDRFNGGEGSVFLISLKAGGTGLNLTGADLVIHYDPWWNPAAEDQATDRAHRIGQTRDVDVLKLIAKDTIEEKVMDLSGRKRAVFDRVVLAGETALSGLTEEDIRALFF